MKYAKSMGLGGIMFWSYDLDDFFGSFCGQEKYPLLGALASADINGNYTRAPTTASTTQLTTKSVKHTHRRDSLQNSTDSNLDESASNSKPTGSSPEPETTAPLEWETTTRVVQAQTPKPAFKIYVVENGANYMFLCNILLLFSLSISFVCNMI